MITYIDRIKQKQITINIQPGRFALYIFTAPPIALGWLAGILIKILALTWASIVYGYEVGR